MRLSSAMRIFVLMLLTSSTVGAGVRLQSGAAVKQARASSVPFLDSMRLAAIDLGPVAPATPLSTVLILNNLNAAREAADLAALYTPGSPRFGHYLSAARLTASYGPSSAAVDQVRAVLHDLGMNADWHPGNDWLIATGSARTFGAAFKVDTRWYRSPRGSRFYAADQAPALPAALRPYVTSVSRVSSYFEPSRFVVPTGGLAPTDLLGAYDIAPLRNLGLDGAGQTVVFFESDGFAQSDLDTFTSKFGLPPMQPVIKAGLTLAAGAETEMDLEVVHEIAPAAKLVIYNFDFAGAIKKATSGDQFLRMQLDLQNQMVNENPGAVISQ
ncbi:MAG: protease pro-enzyme activation domain-containing protein, partial [Chloroflexota bacterium]